MRLFVAVNLPEAERHAAWDSAAALREAALPVKWARPDGLHLTLKFLGEVDEERAASLGPALEAALRRLKPFDLALGGFGAFPDLDHPRVLWLGVEQHPALELLANDVELALRPFGFEPELRPFHPHVTLGRARRDAGSGEFAALENLAETVVYSGMMTVTSADLMRSVAGKGGAEYRLLHAAPLAGIQ